MEKFISLLRTKGAITNISVQYALIDFVKERERMMRTQEDIEQSNDERQKPKQRRSIKESFSRISDCMSDGARSFREQFLGSFQYENAINSFVTGSDSAESMDEMQRHSQTCREIGIDSKKKDIYYRRSSLTESFQKFGDNARSLKVQLLESFQHEVLEEESDLGCNKRFTSRAA